MHREATNKTITVATGESFLFMSLLCFSKKWGMTMRACALPYTEYASRQGSNLPLSLIHI